MNFHFIRYLWNELRVLYPLTKGSGYKTRNSFHKYHMKWKFISDPICTQKAQRATYRAPEYNLPPFLFTDRPKNTKLVEDVEILLPVKFRWIPFSGFRGEIKNISANQRPGRPSCFSDQHKKHKLGRGRWDYASSQVSLNSVQQFQRRSQKCLSQSETWAAILFFRSAWKTQTW